MGKLEKASARQRSLPKTSAIDEPGPYPPVSLRQEGRTRHQRFHGLAGPHQADITCELVSPLEPEEQARAILESIAEGDQIAFWALWQRHQEHLFAVCLRQMRGIHADAEDALSRAMLRALDKMPRYAGQLLDPKAWLTRLTYNVCVETHREHSRRLGKQRRQQGADIEYEKAIFLGGSPEGELLHRELFDFLKERIDGLSERLRKPFILRFLHEMSCREVAAELNLSSENVRKRIQQARIILRRELAGYLSSSIIAAEIGVRSYSDYDGGLRSGAVLVVTGRELALPHELQPELVSDWEQVTVREALGWREQDGSIPGLYLR
jgi:RNA polymerase sigma factor (sigma-70 family)